MRKLFALLFWAFYLTTVFANPNRNTHSNTLNYKTPGDTLEDAVVEPWSYSENFEDRELGAWASYPHWQDIAYDQNFRVNEIIPGDPNISIVQKVTPYTNVDNYAGAQKLLDMYLLPGSTVTFRYYLKTNQYAGFYKIR